MLTPEQTEARFQRIEASLDRVTQRMEAITQAHVELEAAQLNQAKAHMKLEESLTRFSDETRERLNNLTILVDRLVARDL